MLGEGDYVKTIDCFLNEKDLIVGISMVSHRSTAMRAGLMTSNRQTIVMEPEEHPTCFYGCLIDGGVEMLGVEVIQEES